MPSGEKQLNRPRPDIRGSGHQYWKAGLSGELKLPKCGSCGEVYWYPRTNCPKCGSDNQGWVVSSGKGKVHTFTVVRHSRDPFFQGITPYVVAMVELEEGPKIMSNIVQCDVGSVRCDMQVSVVFEKLKDIAIPLFRPA